MVLAAFGRYLDGLFRGGAGEFYRPFCEEPPLKGRKSGRCRGNDGAEKRQQKKGRSNDVLQP